MNQGTPMELLKMLLVIRPPKTGRLGSARETEGVGKSRSLNPPPWNAASETCEATASWISPTLGSPFL